MPKRSRRAVDRRRKRRRLIKELREEGIIPGRIENRSKCEHCGATAHLTKHHIIPKSDGGLDRPDNIQILCRGCHDVIHDMVSKYKGAPGLEVILRLQREV